MDSTLDAQAAQVIPVTGNDFLISDFLVLSFCSKTVVVSIALSELLYAKFSIVTANRVTKFAERVVKFSEETTDQRAKIYIKFFAS